MRRIYERINQRLGYAARASAGRVVMALGVAASASAAAGAQQPQLRVVQAAGQTISVASVPYAVGEELTYRATFSGIHAGTARMRVDGIEVVRGRPAYHVVFSVDGGVPLFRVHDRYESWIDTETLSSLRHKQIISEGRYHRTTTYEMFPDRAEYRKNDEDPQASVTSPLDDGSFIYAVRIAGIHVGDTVRNERYFKPDKNPVVLIGLREDTVSVGAGTFVSTVVRPTIKTSGIFSEHGDAQVWFTNDEHRYPVQLKTKFSKFSLTLALESVTAGTIAMR